MADVKWIKLMVGMFDGASFKKIKRAKLKDGTSYRDKLTAVWFELLDLAAKKNQQGLLCNIDELEIPFTSEAQFEDIAIMIDREPEEVACCIAWFVKYGMITIVDDVYALANWEKYQEEDKLAQIREQNRIRQKNYYDKHKSKKLDNNVMLTLGMTSSNALDIDKEEDIDKELNIKENNKKKNTTFQKPTLEEVKTYCKERKNSVDAERFIAYYESNGWKVGRNPMKDWKMAIITWEKRDTQPETTIQNKYQTGGFETL